MDFLVLKVDSVFFQLALGSHLNAAELPIRNRQSSRFEFLQSYADISSSETFPSHLTSCSSHLLSPPSLPLGACLPGLWIGRAQLGVTCACLLWPGGPFSRLNHVFVCAGTWPLPVAACSPIVCAPPSFISAAVVDVAIPALSSEGCGGHAVVRACCSMERGRVFSFLWENTLG